MEQQRHLMKCVLDDTRLNSLRLEGGTVLARIRKEEACENENYRYCRKSGWTLNQYEQCLIIKTSFIMLLFSLFV